MKFSRIILSSEQKAAIRRIAALAAGIAAGTVFISIFSYLLHWKQDMGVAQEVRNAAGTLGSGLGRFLVCECFGLGSIAIGVILAFVCVKLFGADDTAPKKGPSILKVIVVCLLGAYFFSVLFGYVSGLFKLTNLFGGGMGGHCGAVSAGWLVEKTGAVPAVAIILFVILCFLCFSSERFLRAFASMKLFARKKKEAQEPEEAEKPVEQECEAPQENLPPQPEKEEDVPSAVVAPEMPPQGNDPSAEVSKSEGQKEPQTKMEVIEAQGLDVIVKKELPRIDNRMDPPDGLPKYKFPPLDLLRPYDNGRVEVSNVELTKNKNKICTALSNYKIQVSEVKAVVGPTVTLYKVYLAPGVKIASVRSLQDDIAISLVAKGVRVITLEDAVGIEVANEKPMIVPLRGLLNDRTFRESKAELPVAIGYTITQEVKVFDLADAPHLLVAGATKQGKSVGLNVIINSLLYSKHPSELKFVFVDPKMVEFSAYNKLIKHYLAVLPAAESEQDEMNRAIVKKAVDAEKILRSLCVEMDDRYELLAKAGVNKISVYNDKFRDHKLNPEHGHRFLPYLVVVVDEYADLTMSVGASAETKNSAKSITTSIIRLAQKGRAAGLHVIIATQRPSVDVISGIIKSNFPMRIAFRTTSVADSRTILDTPGAEKLIGKGDMLFSAGIDNERIQCAYIDSDEIDSITEFIGSQTGYARSYNTPYYLPEPPSDEKSSCGSDEMGAIDERFEDAARLVVSTGKASTSFLQTRLSMGFAKAARVMSQLETAGIVGPQDGSKMREVLVDDPVALEEILELYR